jgi:hypothetical protein
MAQAMAAHREETAPRTDALVETLRDVVVAQGQEGSVAERRAAFDAVIGGAVVEAGAEPFASVGRTWLTAFIADAGAPFPSSFA